MGFSEVEKVCNEHPYHHQKQGVCPSCLRNKLAQLHIVPLNDKQVAMAAPSFSSSLMSSTSSASSSNHVSPIHHDHRRHHHQRNVSDMMNSISFRVISAGNNGLKKSRSMAVVTRSSLFNVGVGEGKHYGKKKKKKKKKKEGFWSKLLHLKSKKDVNFDGNKIAFNI